ncbi:hypothetical protein ACAF76_009925 [Brevibacillus sp. TJ4]|uniref:hypothetical protein n=1 Tax=Brevibacillus sp. TJ4 TaxID=3234853 RepID=UPI003B9FC44B
MLKKLMKLLGGHSYRKPYRKYSSSDYYRHRKYSSSDYRYRNKYGHPPHPGQGHGHSHYGHSHYKKRKYSRSFFSS